VAQLTRWSPLLTISATLKAALAVSGKLFALGTSSYGAGIKRRCGAFAPSRSCDRGPWAATGRAGRRAARVAIFKGSFQWRDWSEIPEIAQAETGDQAHSLKQRFSPVDSCPLHPICFCTKRLPVRQGRAGPPTAPVTASYWEQEPDLRPKARSEDRLKNRAVKSWALTTAEAGALHWSHRLHQRYRGRGKIMHRCPEGGLWAISEAAVGEGALKNRQSNRWAAVRRQIAQARPRVPQIFRA